MHAQVKAMHPVAELVRLFRRMCDAKQMRASWLALTTAVLNAERAPARDMLSREERAALCHRWETFDTRSRVYPSRCLAISKASSGGR